jgi:hypothetical protein
MAQRSMATGVQRDGLAVTRGRTVTWRAVNLNHRRGIGKVVCAFGGGLWSGSLPSAFARCPASASSAALASASFCGRLPRRAGLAGTASPPCAAPSR